MQVSYKLEFKNYYRTWKDRRSSKAGIWFSRAMNAIVTGVFIYIMVIQTHAYLVHQIPFQIGRTLFLAMMVVWMQFSLFSWLVCRLSFHQLKADTRVIDLSWDDKNIKYQLGSQRMEAAWGDLADVIETKDQFSIWLANGYGLPIPKSAFTNPQQIQLFRKSLDKIKSENPDR